MNFLSREMEIQIREKLDTLGASFLPFLEQDEKEYLSRIAGLKEEKKANVLLFKDWDWFQGVGLYGFWEIYCFTGNEACYEILVNYYEKQMKKGLPPKNINSVSPMLALTYLYEKEGRKEWLVLIKEWADWLLTSLPKTKEGGFQHVTAESDNSGQLWDDTLFVAVLFLLRAGELTENHEYTEAGRYQFLLHEKYLADPATGLWYHGFTFHGRHNYGRVFWARGNSWITLAIPKLLEITGKEDGLTRYMTNALQKQAMALKRLQDESGLWHTVLDDPDSYTEASGSAGIAAGLLMGVKMGLLGEEYLEIAFKAVTKMLSLIDENGMVRQVSIGTPLGENREFYKNIPLAPMAYGQALCMLYFIELLKVCK